MDQLNPNGSQGYLVQQAQQMYYLEQEELYAQPVGPSHRYHQNNGEHEDSIFSAVTIENVVVAASILQGSVEWALDIAGYIPGVSTVTAPVRFGLGLGQMASGVAIAVAAYAASFFTPDSYENMMDYVLGVGVSEVVHGAGNSIRSFFEYFQWLNLICLGYDLLADNEKRALHIADPRAIFGWLGLEE